MAVASTCFVFGCLVRYSARDYGTSDAFRFLLPWIEHARLTGLGSLGSVAPSYNYTPFYGYLLLAAAQFGSWLAPLHLVKAISAVFEFGCAIAAAGVVRRAGRGSNAQASAFSLTWLAPTVILNGPMWGQSESIWFFFVLVSALLMTFERWRSAVIAFGVAFSFKFQAVFFGPLILAATLRGKVGWWSIVAVPILYAVVALPAWILGRSATDLATVYLKQAGTFHELSKNAANVWVFVPPWFYGIGIAVGSVVGAAAALLFAQLVGRAREHLSVNHIVIAATYTLLLLPLLLPKMHDRYLYGFEVFSIVLACVQPRFAIIAVAGQISGLAAYSQFGRFGLPWMLYGGAIINIAVLGYLTAHVVSQFGRSCAQAVQTSSS